MVIVNEKTNFEGNGTFQSTNFFMDLLIRLAIFRSQDQTRNSSTISNYLIHSFFEKVTHRVNILSTCFFL